MSKNISNPKYTIKARAKDDVTVVSVTLTKSKLMIGERPADDASTSAVQRAASAIIKAFDARRTKVPAMTPVVSSNIKAIGYDPEAPGCLYVQFKSGGLYSYEGVPAIVADKFMKAKSKGQFFDQNIKDNYDTSKHA